MATMRETEASISPSLVARTRRLGAKSILGSESNSFAATGHFSPRVARRRKPGVIVLVTSVRERMIAGRKRVRPSTAARPDFDGRATGATVCTVSRGADGDLINFRAVE